MAITVLCIIIYIYLLNSYKFKAQNFYPAIIVLVSLNFSWIWLHATPFSLMMFGKPGRCKILTNPIEDWSKEPLTKC